MQEELKTKWSEYLTAIEAGELKRAIEIEEADPQLKATVLDLQTRIDWDRGGVVAQLCALLREQATP